MKLDIRGMIETSLLDWDGKIVSVIFLPLCNFRCGFCHNMGLNLEPETYKSISEERVFKYLSTHQEFIDGVCITGGEPTLHKDRGLFEILGRIKELGFGVKIDSNGTDPDCLNKVINMKLVDYIAMDIKAPINEKYDHLSGAKEDLNSITESISIIMKSGLQYEFRTTVVPGLLDDGDIENIARHINGAKKFVLQQFVAANCWSEHLRDVKPYQKENLERMLKTAKQYVANTIIRGV
jgi:pyruvate formate lyase activating enzyme